MFCYYLKSSNALHTQFWSLLQNIVVMGFGLVALGLSAAYLAYLRSTIDPKQTYVAISEDGSESLVQKKSKWD